MSMSRKMLRTLPGGRELAPSADRFSSRDITEWLSAPQIGLSQNAICSQWQLTDFRTGEFVIGSGLEVMTSRSPTQLEAVRAQIGDRVSCWGDSS